MRICTRIFWGVCILLGICVPAYATNVGGTISANTVWSVANSPYVVTSNVTVNSSVTLTIEPGVSVYFSSGTRLYVNGTINCSGTSADGIYFGSALELNTPSTAAPGDWSGIVIASGISSVLSYCTVAYATNGIYANDSAAPTITNCTSSNNSLYPISVYPDGVYKTSGNSGIGNGSGDVIAVRGGDITTSQTWITQPLSYRVTGDIVVYGVQNDPTQPCVLTLDAGVAVRFNSSCGLDIGRNHYGWWYGALACAGTEGNGVLLSSSSDSPAAGSWQGVRFYAGTRSDLSNMTYTTVEYGGQGTNGGINCYSSNPTISNCTLQYNSSHGIYADDSASPTITGCSLNNNSAYPIYIHPNYVYNTSGNSGIGNGSGDVIAVRGGDITTSQTWIAQPLTYRVIGDIVVYGVQNDSTQPSVLTLDAGAVVRFNSNCGLDIGRDHYGWWYGALACAGTEGNGVLLSSSSDSPAAGSWQGVRFYAGTRSDLSNMTYTTVEYGGQGTNGGINCYSSNPTISNCTLQYNSGYGIYSDDGAVPYIADCVLNSNGSYPISVYCNNIQGRLTGNTGSGNVSGDYIAIRGGSVTTSQSWIPQPLVYRVTGNVNVYGVQNDEAKPSILTLPSGTTVKFNSGCGLYMGREFYGAWYGALVCEGTEGSHVTLTGMSDTPGSWRGVIFQAYTDDADSVMTYTDVTYAGQDTSANIRCESSEPTILHCTIANSSGYGIYADDGALPYLSDNTLDDNTLYPISVYCNNIQGRLTGNTGSDNISGDYIVVRGGNVTTSQSWIPQPLVYRVTGNVNVYGVQNDEAKPSILTLPSGTTVKFNSGCGLYMGREFYGAWYGALVCEGTEGSHVILTGVSETPGSWRGVIFQTYTDDADSVMIYTDVTYAGQDTSANIRCESSEPTISHCTITNSSGYGIYADNGAAPYLSDNTINDNATYPISVYCNNVLGRLNGNTGSDNASGDVVVVRGGAVTTSQTYLNEPLPYRVTSAIEVYGVQNDATQPCILTIGPGTTVEFNSGCYIVLGRIFYGPWYGALVCAGTNNEHIVLTGATETPGSWNGIYFKDQTDDADSVLEYTEIRYAGTSYSANIRCQAASPTITNCVLTDSSAWAIYCDEDASPQLTGNIITDCNGGIRTSGASPTITNNTIVYNTGTQPAISASSSTTDISNNIVAFNNYGIYVSGGTVTLHCNDVYSNTNYQYSGISAAGDDISVDPQFANVSIDNYRLLEGSGCIDKGYDNAVDSTWYDLEFEPRVNGSHVDIGADEYYGSDASAPDTVITSGPAAGSTVDSLPVNFICSGIDNATAAGDLQYSWRIDGGEWSEFSTQTTHSYDDLSEGDHTVEVKAKDEAGNIDPTPATRHFHTSVQRVLFINVSGSYNSDGESIFTTLQNAGANAFYVLLDTEGKAASQISSIDFDQIWVYDLSTGNDAYTSDWQAIADWYTDHTECAIICDARMLSSYWNGQWQDEGQKLTENYYENIKDNGGGLVLGTGHSEYQTGINSINDLIGLEQFMGDFDLSMIPIDTISPLMTTPNDMGTELYDDSSSGQAPFGLQTNGRILYTVAWHSGSTDNPGISSTIRGGVGFHSTITSPLSGSSYIYGADIAFAATTTGGTAPYTYKWSSDIDGVLSTQQSFTTYTLSVGKHVIALTSTDSAGRIDEVSVIVYVTEDASAPDTSITSGPSNNSYTCTDAVTFTFTGSDDATPTSRLVYRWSLDDGAWSTDSAQTTVDLSGLATGSHTFEVAAVDIVGNIDASPASRSFNIFLSALEITDIVVSASQGDATVTWTTPIPADSTVEYGLTDSYELTPVSSSSMVTSHSISLTDLDPSTTYHYRVRSTDSCGREQISDDGTFTTPALPDLDAEFVSATDIAYAGLTASIKWRVTNVGSAVSMKSWTDCVYLSTDDQLSSDDISLVYMMRPLNLQPDANYTQTATVTLPMVTAGNYWLLLKADSEDTQPETDEDNNIAAYGPIDMRIMYIPVIAAIADESAVEGQAYTGPTPVLASGTLPVTWSLISGPSGMTIDHSTGVVIWSDPKGLPSGYTVTIQATNDAGAGTQSWQLTVPISYTASVNADIDSAVAGTPVHLSGSATWTENGTPAAGVSVAVRVLVKNTRRVYSVKTDTNGNFSYTFNPLANEAGRYSVAADHPNVTTDTVQDTFVLYGMAVNPSSVSEEVIPGTPLSDEVDLKNLGDVELTGVTATVLNAPSNLTVDVDCPSQLDASEIAALGYTLTASGDQDMSGTITIELESDQEAATSLTMPIHIKPDRPVLTAGTSPLQASMLRGTQTLVSVDITNSGGVSTTSLNVAIPSCSWMALATPTTIDPIAPGEKASIVLSLTPSETQELVEYDGTIVISSTTASLTLPFEFDCVSDKLGDLVLTAVDEFTYYAEGSPNVADAYVTLTRVDDASIVITGTTDSNGVAEFNNLPEAYYNIKLQALEHGPFTGSVLVEADQTREVTAFMPRELVTYVWKVVPTLIEDKYEITVEAIFETNVPAPVVTIEPANIDLSEMVDGRMQVDLTITNHGLIAAEEFELEFGDNPKYQFTPLTDKIGTLAAQTTVVVPLTIVDIEMHPEEHISQVSNVSKRDAKMSIMGDTSSSDPCIKLKAGALYVLKCGDDGKWKWIPINVVYPENVCPGSSTRPPSVSWWGGGGGRPSGGGWTGGGGGTSSTPYVSSSYVLTEPLCDPCMDKLGSCVMSFLPLGCGVGAVSSAGTAIYGCIGSDWISCIESILNGVAGTVVGCLDDVPIIGTAWNIYNCIKDMYSACWSGSSTKTTSAIERYNALTGRKMRLQDVGGDLNAAADYLELQADRIKPILDLYVEIFGDPIWLSAESVDTSLGTWFTAFYAATGEETPDGKSISADERTSLLNMTRPSQLTDSDVEKFLDRWNRTMEYYAAGIGTIDQVPDGQSTDFIPADEFKSKLLDAKTSLDEMEAEGFTEIFGGLSYASDQYIEATTNQDSGICARVKIQIEQEAVIARNAFKATLELENAGSSSLENVQVIVSIKDEESVTSNSLFGITDSALDGISDVDGDGVLSAGSTCKAEWTLVPTNDAAPTENKIYYVGATLNYTLNGSQVSVPIFPDAITVKPNPSLHLNYFMQKYVYSDDPFTDEVEPAEPFSLGLLVTNSGYGTAYDFQITSAQPQIIENEKGLLIDFKIIGTQIGTQEVSPSLTADFGDLAPQDTAVARWLMTSTLQGKFIDYSATYEHITDLGDLHLTSVDGDQTDDLSLINGVDIHELIHVVRIDVPGDDNKPDFLVNDEPDINSLPDIVYSSDATTAPVTSVTGATISGTLSPTNLQVHLSASAESGWCYIRGTDPGVERYRLTRVIRSDGREIMVDENAWTTHRTIRKEGQDPYRQHLVHIFDFDSTGEYTLIYEKVTSSTTTALAKQEADGASVSLGEDESLIVTAVFDGYFYVEPTDRVCGIRVTWSGEVSVGDSLTLSGTMGTTSSFERCLIADKVTVTGSGYTIEPFVMTNDSLGGCDLDYDATDGSGQRGIEYCSGANNIGLLVKTTGKVTAAGRTYFYIDDGTHANDGSIFQGVRVISGTLTKPTRGDYVTVTGISSILRVGDHIFRSITPRSASDIEIAGP